MPNCRNHYPVTSRSCRETAARAASPVGMRCALLVLLSFAAATTARAVNGTPTASLAGKTPEIVGYNCGHFMPGSNTADWWRFSGVNGARIFSTPTTVEASDDLAPWGDGVSSQTTFV